MAVEHPIREIMSKDLITVKPQDTVKKVIDLMIENNISCVIVEKNNKPTGIITEKDLIRRVLATGKNPKTTRASSIMTKDPVIIPSETTLDKAAKMMQERSIRRLVVMDDEEIGLVTQTDIIKKTAEINDYNKKLTFHQTLQSYVIIGLAAIVVLALILRWAMA